MEFATYQQAKIAINKFDGAMTKGKAFFVQGKLVLVLTLNTGQTISIRLLPPVVQRGPAGPGKPQGASGGDLLSRISGGKAHIAAAPRDVPRGGARGGRGT